MELLVAALGLMLIIEGLIPLLMPKKWKKIVLSLLQLPDDKLQIIGGVFFATGCTLFLLAS
ncbi:MAG: DUF2065 domain-containing protein [Gammaproteobacteria bacterium]|nr:DUF2065 domain-containing protein [Gammaproteobacteria bacterium]MDH5629755.1 DUF2065 domain-containing protein [Gammaproteobacteria bacterium]